MQIISYPPLSYSEHISRAIFVFPTPDAPLIKVAWLNLRASLNSLSSSYLNLNKISSGAAIPYLSFTSTNSDIVKICPVSTAIFKYSLTIPG